VTLIVVVVVAAMTLTRPAGPTLAVVAGLGTDGFSGDGGPALVAQFSEFGSMFFDTEGRLVIADSQGGFSPQVGLFIDRTHIRRIARDGRITTLAGDGVVNFTESASAVALRLSANASAAPGPDGAIFITFGYVEPGAGVGRIGADGTFRLLAGARAVGYSGDGGPARLARLLEPRAIAVDARDGTVFVLDTGASVVRAISPNGTITTFAGTGERGNTGDGGPATSATLFAPIGIALSNDGSLFIADTNNDRVRRVDHGGNIVPVLGGLSKPSRLAFGPDDVLYIADTGNSRVLRVASDGSATVAAGPQGLLRPTALAIDASGVLFIGDSGLHQILKIATR
jgi:serine/threonine-protein kinase